MSQTPDGIALRVLRWPEAARDALAVRHAVFTLEQGIPAARDHDASDALSWHCLALDATGLPLGTGRLLPDGHIGRMAVRAEARGRGIGGAMLCALCARAQADGMLEVVLNAQLHAAGLYQRHGFERAGADFLEVGIVHVPMHRLLGAAAS